MYTNTSRTYRVTVRRTAHETARELRHKSDSDKSIIFEFAEPDNSKSTSNEPASIKSDTISRPLNNEPANI